MKLLILFFISSIANAAVINPMRLPVWSDLDKYQNASLKVIPLQNNNYIAVAGLNYGGKNGVGLDAMACRKISGYLCGGARLFLGSLSSAGIVRTPTGTEVANADLPKTSEYETILLTPENWFAFIPEIGLSVHSQIIPLVDDLWSESAWFGVGRAFIGGRTGWAFSFEPGMNKRLSAESKFGWTARVKYSFGWLSANNEVGTIPYDWFNLTAGIFYLW